jgi:hypothetical protein
MVHLLAFLLAAALGTCQEVFLTTWEDANCSGDLLSSGYAEGANLQYCVGSLPANSFSIDDACGSGHCATLYITWYGGNQAEEYVGTGCLDVGQVAMSQLCIECIVC